MPGWCDRAYYRDRGWFEADYYYPTHLGPFNNATGALFGWAAARMFRQRDARPGDVRAAPERG